MILKFSEIIKKIVFKRVNKALFSVIYLLILFLFPNFALSKGTIKEQLSFIGKEKDKIQIYLIDNNKQINISTKGFNYSGTEKGIVWSPNGKYYAFSKKEKDNAYTLYLSNFNGNHLTKIKEGTKYNLNFSWSPDSNYLAFIHVENKENANGKIYIADMKQKKLLTLLKEDNRFQSSPTWSPNGNKIAFLTENGGNDKYIQVMSISKDKFSKSIRFYGQDPQWTPDSNKIVYMSNEHDDFEVFITDIKTNKPIPLTNNDYFDGGAVVSPDGSKIIFKSNREGLKDEDDKNIYHLFIMNIDGSSQKNITKKLTKTSIQGAKWSFDSKKIAFFAIAGLFDFTSYLVNLDGSQLQEVTTNLDFEWSPVSYKYVFCTGGKIYAFVENDDNYNIISKENTFYDSPRWRIVK